MMTGNFRPKRKSDKLQTGSSVLHRLFENGQTPLSVQFIRWKLWKKWPEFVGQSIGSASEPVGYYRGTLHVWVKSSTWLQQMVFMREAMKEAINKKLSMDYVTEIRLTLDRRSVPADAETSEELRKSIESLMAETPDEQI